jgi:hypothetical protein
MAVDLSRYKVVLGKRLNTLESVQLATIWVIDWSELYKFEAIATDEYR